MLSAGSPFLLLIWLLLNNKIHTLKCTEYLNRITLTSKITVMCYVSIVFLNDWNWNSWRFHNHCIRNLSPYFQIHVLFIRSRTAHFENRVFYFVGYYSMELQIFMSFGQKILLHGVKTLFGHVAENLTLSPRPYYPAVKFLFLHSLHNQHVRCNRNCLHAPLNHSCQNDLPCLFQNN